MRQWIWRRVVASAASVLLLAGTSAAQPPASLPAIPQAPAVILVPVQSPAGASAMPAAPTAGSVVVSGNGSCTNCGKTTANRGFVMSGGGGYFANRCQFGQDCNNGCGSIHSNLKFTFGPCSSFFAPCGPGFYDGKCKGTPVYGHGPRVGSNPCIYDSNLNH